MVLIYVDDIIVAGNNSTKISWLNDHLNSQFHIKNLGPLKYFLGIEVARSHTGIFLKQRKYVLDVLVECGLTACKPCKTPMEQHHQLDLIIDEDYDDPAQYRLIIERLLYLTITRPDISHAVHILSQFMNQPKLIHFETAMCVLHYLKSTPGQGIFFPSDNAKILKGYCDVDWADSRICRKSTTGYIIFLGSSPISWRSKKQSMVSRSIAEAEYRAMATTTSEIAWLVRLFKELGISQT